MSTDVICRFDLATGRYELVRGGEPLGFLAEYRLVTREGEWTISVRRRRGGWYAAVSRDGASDAEAEYRPRALPGGVLLVRGRRYTLVQRLLSGRWRLRGARREPAVTITARGSQLGPWPSVADYAVEAPWSADAWPDFALVVLLAVWAIRQRAPDMPEVAVRS